MSGARPAAVTTPFVALAAVTLAMHVVSRTTGSGWLVVVVSFLVGLLALSALLPALALAHAHLEVQGPADATAGRPASFAVTTGGRLRGVQLRLVSPAGGWVRVDGPGSGTLPAVPGRRGIVREIQVEVRSGAPFGLVWWRRCLAVPLERPVEVGPSPLRASVPVPAGGDAATDAGAPRAALPSPELPRGVRDYVVGDPPRLVSWVATARHGRVMVKELEAGSAPSRLTLVVDLRGDAAAAEEIASRAAGMAIAALALGAEVVLATAEAGGPRLGPVTSPLHVGRRLARAAADGPPAAPSWVAGVEVVGTLRP